MPARCAWCGASIESSADAPVGRVRCAACAVWTTLPVPSGEELEQAYARWYRPSRGRFGRFGDGLLRRLRSRLAVRLDGIAPPGRVLDVGAGDGSLVDALRRRGREAEGIDPRSPHPGVREAELEEVGGRWAAIVFWHSLEHLPAAGDALDRAASMLDPGGLLVIAMPNPGSLQAGLFGERWFANDLPRHLVHVPAPALLARLRRLDLSIERVSYLRGGQVVFGWLHGLVGLLPGNPDLYSAIRRPEARQTPMTPGQRSFALISAALLLPAALLCTAVEVACRRGGSVYVEAVGV